MTRKCIISTKYPGVRPVSLPSKKRFFTSIPLHLCLDCQRNSFIGVSRRMKELGDSLFGEKRATPKIGAENRQAANRGQQFAAAVKGLMHVCAVFL